MIKNPNLPHVPDISVNKDFNWIETETNSPSGFPVMECKRCGAKGGVANTVDFTKHHSYCQEKSKEE
jgi:hypothetical protein